MTANRKATILVVDDDRLVLATLAHGLTQAGYDVIDVEACTRAGIAVSAMTCGLLPLSQTSMRFVGHIGYHDYEGPAVDLDERERIVEDLGPHDALIMRNHGLLICGATIQQALNTMYQLELSCRSQVDAMAARTELTMPGENVLAHTAHLYQPGTRRPYGVLEWPAMLRLLDAEDRNSGYPPYWN